jgi:hypothetical protein
LHSRYDARFADEVARRRALAAEGCYQEVGVQLLIKVLLGKVGQESDNHPRPDPHEQILREGLDVSACFGSAREEVNGRAPEQVVCDLYVFERLRAQLSCPAKLLEGSMEGFRAELILEIV